MRPSILTLCLFGILGHILCLNASALDEIKKAFEDQPTEQNIGAMIRLLQEGAKEKRSAEALAAAATWLQNNTVKDEQLILELARAYHQAGLWPDSVRYYQRYFEKDKFDQKVATKEVEFMYQLQISFLKDSQNAYSFMGLNGAKLRKYGNAKQYDHWLLKQATSKMDVLVMSEYLTAVFKDGKTDHTKYHSYLDALAKILNNEKVCSKEEYEAVIVLAKLPPAAKWRYRLEWPATIHPYNQRLDQILGSRGKDTLPETDTKTMLEVASKRAVEQKGLGMFEVSRGFFGANNSRNAKLRMGVHAKLKQAFLLKHYAMLKPNEMGKSFRSGLKMFRHGHNHGWDYVLDTATCRALVLKVPEAFNSRSAFNLPLMDKDIKMDEAKKLAPILRANPHLSAGVIRAFAAAGPSFPKVVEEIWKNEMWRYKRIYEPAKYLWDYGPKRDGDFNKISKKHKSETKHDPRYTDLLALTGADAPVKTRNSTFEKVWKDMSSKTPSIREPTTLLKTILANTKLEELDELLAIMVNPEGAANDLYFSVIAGLKLKDKKGKRIYPPNSNSGRHHGQNTNFMTLLPKTHEKLNQTIEAMVGKNKSVPYAYALTWFNFIRDYTEPTTVELAKKIYQSPIFSSYHHDFRHWFSERADRFGPVLQKKTVTPKGPGFDKELKNLPQGALPPEVFKAFNTVVERMKKEKRSDVIESIYPLGEIPKYDEKTTKNILELFSSLIPTSYESRHWQVKGAYEKLATKMIVSMVEADQWDEFIKYSSGFWKYSSDVTTSKLANSILDFAEAALDAEKVSIASTIIRQGFYSKIEGEAKSRIKALMGKVDAALGVTKILVDRTDPTYPIFSAQSEFLKGNEDAAWSSFMEAPELASTVVRKLNPDFSFWAIQKSLTQGEAAIAKKIGQELYIWSVREKGSLDTTQEGQLRLAMGDIAFKDGNFVMAKSQYQKIILARAYRGTQEQFVAQLGTVKVDMATKDYGAALQTLEKMVTDPIPDRRMKAHHVRAKVYYAQGNYAEARQEVDTILSSESAYNIGAEAMILKGDISVKERNFEAGEEIEVGFRDSKTTIIPGEPITIKLVDQSLSISGDSSTIEVEVKAKSGDAERLLLRAEGDDKTTFRARIMSELGKPKKNDKVLQILGEDEITYGYSKRFRSKMKDLPPDNNIVMSVKSNSSIAMAAGDFPAREGERQLNLALMDLDASQKALGTRRVRPGNPLYIRVTDPDQSKTPKKDTVKVDLETSSGDKISNIVLTETSEYSGEFQASIPTASAITTAYASDSEKGTNPNDAVSPRTDSQWKGDAMFKPAKGSSRFFTVDFNDKVPLSKLTLHSPEEGKLKEFLVQTSKDGTRWISRAGYPKSTADWDGSPEMALAHAGHEYAKPKDGELPPSWKSLFELGSVYNPHVKRKSTKNLVPWPPRETVAHPGHGATLRFRALFFQSSIGERTFQLTGFPDDGNNVFLIDGKPSSELSDLMTITRELQPGIHQIQVWRRLSQKNLKKLKPVLLSDSEDSSDLKPCSEDTFSTAFFPPLIRKTIPDKVKIASQGGDFLIDFGQNIEARAVRFLIHSHEGNFPVINSFEMTDLNGKKRLPTDSDYRELRTNRTLEVLPGDKVSVVYKDDNFIGKDVKKKVDVKGDVLSVAFNDGSIMASFLKYENVGDKRRLMLEDIRRFKMGSDIAFIIDDVDMDVSTERDQIKFKVSTSNGFSRELVALETDAHSGQFLGRFYPQLNKSTRPAEIEITHGATISATYLDTENVTPGIPTERSVTIEHAKYFEPTWAARTLSTEALPYLAPPSAPTGQKANNRSINSEKTEKFFSRRKIVAKTSQGNEGATLITLINSNVGFSVLAPHLALAESSMSEAYVQTESARQISKKQKAQKSNPPATPNISGMPFDLNVPGTLKIKGSLKGGAGVSTPPGYSIGSSQTRRKKKSSSASKDSGLGGSLDKGRFAFFVPVSLGSVPELSYSNRAAENLLPDDIPEFLAVRPGDKVHVAFPYFEEEDFYNEERAERIPKWHTFTYSLDGHVFMDMLDSTFSYGKSTAFVGEKVYLRVVSQNHDTSHRRDEVKVTIRSESGNSSPFTLKETDQHTGIFRGIFRLTYLTDPIQKDEKGNVKKIPPVELNGFPVLYNDTLTVSWAGGGEEPPPPVSLTINSGSDGLVKPFSKRFADGGMAVKTSFTMAECFFELAKKHKEQAKDPDASKERKKEGESLARRKMRHAEKLLMEALSTHRDEEQQAHAEYLLGNLAQEYAALSKNDMSKKNSYSDALARYKKVVTDFPDATFASKAQYKVAWVYDKMAKMDGMNTMETAVDEYVKLAYKFPEDELIPKVMARIAQYFVGRGKDFKKEAQEFEKKNGEKSGDGIMRKAHLEYLKAAQVYEKLAERFPADPLAQISGLAAAMNYMRANFFDKAVDNFKPVISNEELDGDNVRSQALFWSGFCFEKGAKSDMKLIGSQQRAVQFYNRTRFEFPSSRWAKQARGRLVDPALAEAVEKEDRRKERLLEALENR
jgi:tetratricopeptide (TPR) repeat protein